MRTRLTCRIVEPTATFLEAKAASVRETLNPLDQQDWELVAAQQIGTSACLDLMKEN